MFFFFSSRRRHTRCSRDWSSDVCSSDLFAGILELDSPPQPGSSLVEVVRQTELIEAVRDVLKGAPRVEAEIITGTLRRRFFAATVASVKATENSGAVVVLHDITDLRKLERVRRDIVANVSHEFKRSEEHTSELQSRLHLVCRLLLEKKKTQIVDVTGV